MCKKHLGDPLFSSNSYFQFVDNSIVSKYMSPFWKLQYGVDVASPFTYPLSYSADFLKRALRYTFDNTFSHFIKFGGSFWLWIPLTYALTQRQDDTKKRELIMVFCITLLLTVLLTAPLGLNINYVQFMYIPLIIIAAKTVHRWYVSVADTSGAHEPVKPVDQEDRVSRFFFLLALFIVPVALFGRISLKVLIITGLFTVAVAVVGLIKKRAGMILLYSSVISLFSSVLYIKDYSEKFAFKAYTVEEPSVLRKVENATSPKEIILATHFWNTGWFSHRPSVPVPEYLDEIYLLIKKYGLNIKAIYISHVDAFVRYSSPRIPLSYHSYVRLTEKNLPIRGFSRVEPSVKGSLLLYRDDDLLSDVLNTAQIDFGEVSTNSHLVYGFSPPATLDGLTVCWILRDSGSFPFEKQKFGLVKNGGLIEYDNPDAEITFLRDGIRPLNHVKVRLFNLNPGAVMTVGLNSNLFSYGEKGFFVAAVPLQTGWNFINLPLENIDVRQGVNKLSFWFKKRETFPSSPQPGISLKNLAPEKLEKETLGIAFDKIDFSYDNNSSPLK